MGTFRPVQYPKTVFILGAGASVPYGFPTGQRLTREITEGLLGGTEFVRALEACGITRSDLHDFGEQFRLSGRHTIDQFLSKRSDLAPIGKKVLAASLIRFESEAKLTNADPQCDWYRDLFEYLMSFDHGLGNKECAVVTFNYDRSLEHFIASACRYSLSLDGEYLSEQMAHLPIVHVHGMLGTYPLPGREKGARHYRPDLTPEDILCAAEQIRVVSEQRGKEGFEEASKRIAQADRLVFLGFGFDATNVANLRLPRGRFGAMADRHLHVEFCTTGMTKIEVSHALSNAFQGDASHGDPLWDAKRFLRERGTFLRDYDS